MTCKRSECQEECSEIFIPSVKEIQRKGRKKEPNVRSSQEVVSCIILFTFLYPRAGLSPHHHNKGSGGRDKKLLHL